MTAPVDEVPAGLCGAQLQGHDVVILLPSDRLAHNILDGVEGKLLCPLLGPKPHLVKLQLEGEHHLPPVCGQVLLHRDEAPLQEDLLQPRFGAPSYTGEKIPVSASLQSREG